MERLSGGNVHDVYTDSGNIIKVRHTGSPTGLENMHTLASDILYESLAIKDAHSIMPENFPDIVDDSDADNGVIVMTRLFPEGSMTLKELTGKVELSRSVIESLANVVGSFHNQADAHLDRSGYRGHEYFNELLQYRYGLFNLPEMDMLVQELLGDTKQRGILHGGLSPKNILISRALNGEMQSRDIGLVDLETSCIGSRYFDIGFCMGHLMLHGIDQGKSEDDIRESFISSYIKAAKTDSLDELKLDRVAYGTMIYRLDHSEAAYPLANIDNNMKDKIYIRFKELFQEGGG